MNPFLRPHFIVSIFLACAFLTGCNGAVTKMPKHEMAEVIGETQKQREMIAKNYDKEYGRLYRAGYPILQANADICEKADPKTVRYGMGALLRNDDIMHGDMHEAIKSALDLDEFLRIAYIAPNMPAARAGLKENDKVTAVNGKPVPYGENALSNFNKLLNRELNEQNKIILSVLRDGKKLDFPITLEKVCNYPIYLEVNREANAFADGKNIVFWSAIMRDLNTDQKIALVFGHETSHNILRHVQKGHGNASVGRGLGILVSAITGVNVANKFADAGRSVNQVDFEAEADYVGTYLAERAGYNVDNAGEVWREMSINNPASVTHGGDHPPHAERFLAIEKTIAEIQEKRRKHLPLLPDMKYADVPADETVPTNANE